MESSKLQQWALGAEIVGAIAVVISLGVVAYQLNQSNEQQELNTNALEIAAYQDLLNSFTDLQSTFIEDGEFSELYVKSNSGLADLSEGERLRIIRFLGTVIRHGDMAFFQYERGTITTEQLDSMLYYVLLTLRSHPAAAEIWSGLSTNALDPDYVTYVNARL